jgi:hypothetical protein
MRPVNEIHKLIKKLQLKASPRLDKRVHDDISKALAKSKKTESASTETNIWRVITKSGVIKLALAAVIFIAFGIGLFIGRWSKPTQLTPHSPDITDYIPAVAVHPTPLKAEDSFWRRKALAAMQPRPYIQTQTTKTKLLNAYKQYLKEKDHD